MTEYSTRWIMGILVGIIVALVGFIWKGTVTTADMAEYTKRTEVKTMIQEYSPYNSDSKWIREALSDMKATLCLIEERLAELDKRK